MRINADFSQRVVVRPSDYQWVPSPMAGVSRMMLDRIGDEVARATSIVRYEPNSTFSPHVHGGGEEFLVLEGAFADEHNRYPAGTYVRNPIGTAHAPQVGAEGATILVKLHQFAQADQRQFACRPSDRVWQSGAGPGVAIASLHSYADRTSEHHERVALVRFQPYTLFAKHQHPRGEEIFVISGTLYDGGGAYPQGTWLRNPIGSRHRPFTRGDGALLYVKTGPLPPE